MGNFGGKKRNGRGGMALYITLAVAFMLIAVFLAMALFFKISDITVEGAKKYSAEEIIGVSGVEKEDSIFFLNAGAAQIAIMDAFPYIDTVKITRSFPGTVVISVTESVPAAYFTADGSCWIIDRNGRILEETTLAGVEGIAELRGVTAVDPQTGKSMSLGPGETVRLRCMKDTLEAIIDNGRLELTTWLDMTNLSAVTFEYNGYKVNIGEAEDFGTKFDLLEKVLKEYTEPGHGQSFIYEKDIVGMRYEP